MANVRQASEDYICTTAAIPRRSFGSLLRHTDPGGAPLRVPLLQRRYCWTAAQLRRLVDDVGADDGGGGGGDWGHCFGRVVVRVDERCARGPLIIDGQQRLTSVALLVAALRDVTRLRLRQGLENGKGVPTGAAAAEELVARCNGWLFPWVSEASTLPPLRELLPSTGPERRRQPSGQAVACAALVPTFLDRDSFWEATHPEATLDGDGDGDDCSDGDCTGPATPPVSLARPTLLEGPDRVRAGKAALMDYLQGSALAAAAAGLGLSPENGGSGGCDGDVSLEDVEATAEEAQVEGSGRRLPASSLTLGAVVRAASALLTSATTRCFVMFFPVREADVWSVYERLAFREAGLQSFMKNSSPGVSMAECDLVRNLLLSYFAGEDEQLAAYRSLWRPMEQAAQTAVVAAPGAPPPPASALPLKRPPPAGELGVVGMLGRLMRRYLNQRQPGGLRDPQEQHAKAQGQGLAGGAGHLASGMFFPTYVAFRQAVEAELGRTGQGQGEAEAGAAVARSILGELLQLSRDPASFREPEAGRSSPHSKAHPRMPPPPRRRGGNDPALPGLPAIRDQEQEEAG
mmetsp:Transcript_38311/g.99522  ORF Transcript_38311/g.99522 Transcript_38311/m.99522 type:complete len:574 (-) Transcript_38311:69-1790(-)